MEHTRIAVAGLDCVRFDLYCTISIWVLMRLLVTLDIPT